MRRNMFLLAALTLITAGASVCAQSFGSMWNEVESLKDDGLVETAYNKVCEIRDMVIAGSDDHELLHATCQMAELGSYFMEDFEEFFPELFAGVLPKLEGNDYKALVHAILGMFYYSVVEDSYTYYDDNAYDCSSYYDSVDVHMDMATALAATADGRMERYKDAIGFFETSDWPRLKDWILGSYIECEQDLEPDLPPLCSRSLYADERLYGSAQDFLAATENLGTEHWTRPLRYLRELTLRNMESDAEVRCNIDLLRMWQLDMFGENSIYDGCAALFDTWSGKTDLSAKFAAWAYRAAAGLEQPADAVEKADSLCRLAVEKWPDSPHVDDCRKQLASGRHIGINLNVHERICADRPNPAILSAINTDKVWLRIVKRYSDAGGEDMLRRQIAEQPIVSWSLEMPRTGRFTGHKFEIPALPQGSYTLLASSDSLMGKESVISVLYFDCSMLTFVQMSDMGGKLAGQIIDMASGEPVRSCTYRLTEWDGTVIREGTAGSFIDIDGLAPDKSFTLHFESDGRKGRADIRVPVYSDGYAMQLFMDRSIYSPGDTVRYSGILTALDGGVPGNAVSGAAVSVDAGRTCAAKMEHVTDGFGAFHGTMAIPVDAVPGDGRLTANYRPDPDHPENVVYYSIPFSIRTIDPAQFDAWIMEKSGVPAFDEPIVLTGKSMTLTGMPNAGAAVKWEITGGRDIVRRGHKLMDHRRILVREGQTETGPDGCFRIPFCIGSDEVNDDKVYLTLRYQVTDAGGHTITKSDGRYLSTREQKRNFETISFYPADGTTLDDSILIHLSVQDVWENHVDRDVHIRVCELGSPSVDCIGNFMTESLLSGIAATNRNELICKPVYTVGRTVCDTVASYLKMKDARYFRTLPLAVPHSGLYRAYAWDDTLGIAIDSIDIYKYIPDTYARAPLDRILTVTVSNREYEPGDSVTVYVGSPVPGTRLFWMTGQGDGGHGSIISNGNIQKLRIPLGDRAGFRNLAIGAYDSLLWKAEKHSIYVRDRKSELKLSFEGFRDRLESGKENRLKITVRDSEGKPVRARILFDMYDLSLDKIDYYGRNHWEWRSNWKADWLDISMPSSNAAITGDWDPYSGMYSESSNVDKALQGRIAGLRVSFSSASVFDIASRSMSSLQELSQAELEAMIRKNLSVTGLFNPGIGTDRRGRAQLDFLSPGRLADWHFQALAYTADMKHAVFADTVMTRRNIMVSPSVPQFLVQGDSIDFTAVVTNNSDRNARVKVRLEMVGLRKAGGEKTVDVDAGGLCTVTFPISVPQDFEGDLIYKITASSGPDGDGEQDRIPVLSADGPVTARVDFDFRNSNRSDVRTLAHTLSLASLLGKDIDAAGLEKLFGCQNADGGWGWTPDGVSRSSITASVMLAVAQLASDGVLNPEGRFKEQIENGIGYLEHSDTDSLNLIVLHSMLGGDVALSTDKSGGWPLKVRAMAAVALKSKALAASLVDRSLYDAGIGRWWRDNQSGTFGREEQLDIQGWIVRALRADFPEQAAEALKWLEMCMNAGTEESHEQAGLTVSRTITPGGSKVGDKATVELTVISDRPLDCVQITDMLPAGLVPADSGARYGHASSLEYYCAPGRYSNMFLIEHLDRGEYVIRYECVITQTGRFAQRGTDIR